jgi:hypothetical protein
MDVLEKQIAELSNKIKLIDTSQQISEMDNEIKLIDAKIAEIELQRKNLNESNIHICSVCECRYIIKKYMVIIDGKKYCSVCNPIQNNIDEDSDEEENEVQDEDSDDEDEDFEENEESYDEEEDFDDDEESSDNDEDDFVVIRPKFNCYECNYLFNRDNVKIGEYDNYYCENCWDKKYDTCYECDKLICSEQNVILYNYDADNRLKCICDDCRNQWLEDVSNTRKSRINYINYTKTKLINFCSDQNISNIFLTPNSSQEIYKLMFHY